MKKFFKKRKEQLLDIGLLILRVTFGLMMAFGHGWGKMGKLVGESPIQFADPLGIGVGPSLFLAGTAEFLAAFFVAIGLKTRAASVPVVITMLVAAFLQHADDPWGKKELALTFAIPFLVLFFTGGGRYSVDHWMEKRFKA